MITQDSNYVLTLCDVRKNHLYTLKTYNEMYTGDFYNPNQISFNVDKDEVDIAVWESIQTSMFVEMRLFKTGNLINREYFTINQIQEVGENNAIKQVQCYSLEYLLGSRNVRRYNDTTSLSNTLYELNTARSATGLGDTAVANRRPSQFGDVDRLYNAFVRHGRVYVEEMQYPDWMGLGMQPLLELDYPYEVKEVDIVFDGRWRLTPDLDWGCITDTIPWIFWLDVHGQLYAQHWDDEETRILLDSNVTSFSAMRGWQNPGNKLVDQGIITAYIKSDSAGIHYRNYVYMGEESNLYKEWSQARRVRNPDTADIFLEDKILNSVRLSLTNDYRTMFMVSYDGDNKTAWALSSRRWQRMGNPPYQLTVNMAHITADFIGVSYEHYPDWAKHTLGISGDYTAEWKYFSEHNEFYNVENKFNGQDWGRWLEIHTKYHITEPITSNFQLECLETGMVFFPDTVEKLDEHGFKLRLEYFNFNGITGDAELTFIPINNHKTEMYAPFSKVFTPINLDPSLAKPPEVEGIWNA